MTRAKSRKYESWEHKQNALREGRWVWRKAPIHLLPKRGGFLFFEATYGSCFETGFEESQVISSLIYKATYNTQYRKIIFDSWYNGLIKNFSSLSGVIVWRENSTGNKAILTHDDILEGKFL